MRGEPIQHEEARSMREKFTCTCGYQATDARDLEAHFDAMRNDVT